MFTIENLNGEYVGGVNLNSIDEKNGTFSIGVQVDRDHRGKGYGTRAINILLKYAFWSLDSTSLTNVRSKVTNPQQLCLEKWVVFKKACAVKLFIQMDSI